MATEGVLGAILVGGASRRMGGEPKGLLPGPTGEPLVVRAARVLREAGLGEVALVGALPAYQALGLPQIADRSPGRGPLGGLEAALTHASERGAGAVVLVGCDMPYFGPALVGRLLACPPAPAVAPRRAGRFEPLLGRYGVGLLGLVRGRLARGELGLQGLLVEAAAQPLALSPDEEALLDDWDSPEQIRRDPGPAR